MAERKRVPGKINQLELDGYLSTHPVVNLRELTELLSRKGPVSRQAISQFLQRNHAGVQIISQRTSTDITYRDRVEQRDGLVARARKHGETEVRIADALELGRTTVQKSVQRLIADGDIEQFSAPRTGHLPVHDAIIAHAAAGWTTRQIAGVVHQSERNINGIISRNNGGTGTILEAIAGVRERDQGATVPQDTRIVKHARTRARGITEGGAGTIANKVSDRTPSASHKNGKRHGWSLEPDDEMGIINTLESDMSNLHPDSEEN